jgi:hypothetical protein
MEILRMTSKTPPSTPPWNEVLRACTVLELHRAAFSMTLKLMVDRHEPREVLVTLVSGHQSVALEPVHVCTCSAFVYGRRARVVVDDVSTVTGAARMVDVLVGHMRAVRPELGDAPERLLRPIATTLHGTLVTKVAAEACSWNLPPYAVLGKTRARPEQCWHQG